MSKLSINEALKSGVKAHKTGNLQEADRYYTAIIKAVPSHPDANHNLGLLAADLGKRKEALRFFKIAIESNSSVDQYWISYVDALIKLDRIKEAKHLIKKANAETERSIRTLKEELFWIKEWQGVKQVEDALNKWVENYNRTYLHSALGYRSPKWVEENFSEEEVA